MRFRTLDLLLLIALAVAALHYSNRWMGLAGGWTIAEKGACVALLALWAAIQARGTDGWLIALVLALGATGDVLLETHGLTIGALAFLAGHGVATILYLRNRASQGWFAVPVAVLIAVIAFLLPANREAAPGIALYASGLGAMAGTALFSRFPRGCTGLGALLFAASDLLIFARLGPLSGSPLPGLLIWPLYVAGQMLIAWGVVATLREERT